MSGKGNCVAPEVLHIGNAVAHFLSRKTVGRVIRGHQLLDLGLKNIPLENLLPPR